MATEVGVGYVRLVPTMRGFAGDADRMLRNSLVGPSTRAGTTAGNTVTQTMGQRISAAGATMAAAGQTMTAGLTAPILGVGATAIKMSGDFEAALNGVRAVTGASGQDFETLRNQAKELGSTTQFSATEAANAMEFLGMAGFDTKQIMSALPDVLNLAAAGNTDLATMADIASNVMSGFGIEASESGRVADVLAQTMRSTNVDLTMLGESMKYAAPLASAAGLSFEETAAAVGFLGNAGIQGSMAGTGLNSIIATLSDTTSTGGKKLREFGVAAQDSNGQVRSITDVVEDLADKGADVSDVISIFGLEAGPKLQALIGQGSEGLRELTKDLDASDGAAKEMADIRMEGFNGEIKTLQSAFEGLMIAIGDSGVLGVATRLVTKVTDLVSWLSQTDSATLRWASGAATVVAAIGPVLIIVGKTISLLGQSITAIARFVGATARVAAGFVRMTVAAATFIARMTVVAARFTAAAIRMTVQMTITAARVVAGWVLMGVQAMARAAMMAAAWVVAMGPVGWVIAGIVALVALIIANWDKIVAWTGKAWSAVVDFVKKIPQRLISFFLNWTLPGLIIKHWSTIKSKTISIATGIVNWVKGLPGRLISAVASLGGRLFASSARAWTRFRTAAEQKQLQLVRWVHGLPRRLISAVGNLGSLLYSKGADLIRGLIRGVKSMGSWLKGQLMSFAKNMVPGPIAKALGIGSPSKVLADQVGRWVPAGIAQGMRGGLGDIEAAAELSAAATVPGLPSGAATASRAAAAAPTVVIDGTNMPRALEEWLRHNTRTLGGGSVDRWLGQRQG